MVKANNDVSSERCTETNKEENKDAKSCLRRRMKELNKHLERKMNGEVQRNRRFLWKKVQKFKKKNEGIFIEK